MTIEQYQEITKKMWDAAKIGGIILTNPGVKAFRPWKDYKVMKSLLIRLLARWEQTEDASYGWQSRESTFNLTQAIHTIELKQSYYNVRFIYQAGHGSLAKAMWLAVAAKMDLLTSEMAEEFDIYYHREEKTDSGCWIRTHTSSWRGWLSEQKRKKQPPQKETSQLNAVIMDLASLETEVMDLINQLDKLRVYGLAVKQKLYDLRMKLVSQEKES